VKKFSAEDQDPNSAETAGRSKSIKLQRKGFLAEKNDGMARKPAGFRRTPGHRRAPCASTWPLGKGAKGGYRSYKDRCSFRGMNEINKRNLRESGFTTGDETLVRRAGHEFRNQRNNKGKRQLDRGGEIGFSSSRPGGE